MCGQNFITCSVFSLLSFCLSPLSHSLSLSLVSLANYLPFSCPSDWYSMIVQDNRASPPFPPLSSSSQVVVNIEHFLSLPIVFCVCTSSQVVVNIEHFFSLPPPIVMVCTCIRAHKLSQVFSSLGQLYSSCHPGRYYNIYLTQLALPRSLSQSTRTWSACTRALTHAQTHRLNKLQ